MTAVHTMKCKFKEVADSNTLIFYYGYMGGLFGMLFPRNGREEGFTEEDCHEMIANGQPPYQRGALEFNEEVVRFNAKESRKALAALADYRRKQGV